MDYGQPLQLGVVLTPVAADPSAVVDLAVRFAPYPDDFLVGPPDTWVADLLPLVLADGAATLVLANDLEEVLTTFATDVAPALRESVTAARGGPGTTTTTVRSSAIRAARRTGIACDDVPADLAAELGGGRCRAGARRALHQRG